jgi:DNA-binding NtrC family response regulator
MEGSLRVLYLEDDRFVGRAVARQLRSMGLVVAHVDSVSMAVSLLPFGHWDVVLSDFRMAEGDGVDLMRAAAAHCPDSRRVMLTGHPDHPKVVAAVAEGLVAEVIGKPARDEAIRRAIGA